MAVFRVAGGLGAELTELLQLLDRHVRVAGQIEQRVEQHRAVAGREHEAVAVGPLRLLGIEAENLVKRTVAMSAMPIGMPGWPEFAFSTASMERKRIALAIRSCCSREVMAFPLVPGLRMASSLPKTINESGRDIAVGTAKSTKYRPFGGRVRRFLTFDRQVFTEDESGVTGLCKSLIHRIGRWCSREA